MTLTCGRGLSTRTYGIRLPSPEASGESIGAARSRASQRRCAADGDARSLNVVAGAQRQRGEGGMRIAARSRLPLHRLALPLMLLVIVSGCRRSALTKEDEQRLAAEGILHRASDVLLRKTHDRGTSDAGWEEGYAGIVVTKQSVTLYGRDQIGRAHV